jgi:glucose/arabinose dehydrogenase
MNQSLAAMLTLAVLLVAAPGQAQDEIGPWIFDTHTPGPCSPNGAVHGGCPPGELVRIRVVTVAYGLVRPWHLSFLPGGTDMLVSELPGSLRIVRDGKLDPMPIRGWPDAALDSRSLNSVLLHPDFTSMGLLYFSYVKRRDGGETTVALARARFDGASLDGLEEIFVADAWGSGATAGRPLGAVRGPPPCAPTCSNIQPCPPARLRTTDGPCPGWPPRPAEPRHTLPAPPRSDPTSSNSWPCC